MKLVRNLSREDQHSLPPLSSRPDQAPKQRAGNVGDIRLKSEARRRAPMTKLSLDHLLFAALTGAIILVVLMNGDAIGQLNTMLAG
jgi:hypothetical protein